MEIYELLEKRIEELEKAIVIIEEFLERYCGHDYNEYRCNKNE